MDYISTLPSCAPTFAKDTDDVVTWTECAASEADESTFGRTGSSNCKPCIIDPNSSCGQMLYGGGFVDSSTGVMSVPPSCRPDCCKPENVGVEKDNENSGEKPVSSVTAWIGKNRTIILVLLALLGIGLFALLFMKSRKTNSFRYY